MSHLSTERLAAAADDDLTPDEATHVAGCWDCRAELAAYRRLARMSAMAPVPMEPLSAWSSLAPQLRAEGLIVEPAGGRGAGTAGAGINILEERAKRRLGLPAWAVRAAAAVVLLAGGVAAGRMSVSSSFQSSDPATMSAALASIRSSEEAVQILTTAQQQYQQAAAFLAEQDTSARFIGMNRDAYQSRLSALDEIAAAARTALYHTPQDPVLNQYYLTTLGAREATLRQIGASFPESRRLERY